MHVAIDGCKDWFFTYDRETFCWQVGDDLREKGFQGPAGYFSHVSYRNSPLRIFRDDSSDSVIRLRLNKQELAVWRKRWSNKGDHMWQ